MNGRHADLRRDDGTLLKGQHLENMVELPMDVDDWEGGPRPDLGAQEADEGCGRLSPGQLLERKAVRPVPLPVTAQT